MVYGIKPDQREGFILSISKDLLIINFSGKNSHAFYSGRGIFDEFSLADIYISPTLLPWCFTCHLHLIFPKILIKKDEKFGDG